MTELKNAVLRYYRSVVRSIAFYPTLIAAGLLVLAIVMLYAEQTGISEKMYEKVPLLVIRDESTARSVVTTMVGGMISLMVFSFSMVMVLLNQASSNFSPRLLPGLISSKQHQLVLGMYLGTIVYGITMLINIHPKYQVYAVPGASIFLGVVLTVVCLGLFIYFINTISQSIQVTHVLSQIFRKTRRKLLDERDHEERRGGSAELPDTQYWHTVDGTRTGYLNSVSENELLEIARRERTRIELKIPLGGFILSNLPVLSSERPLSEEARKELLSCLEFQLNNSMSDNYVHGFKQITEIALKAMSPGINDPGTCLNALDYLTELFALRLQIDETSFANDEEETLRLIYASIKFKDLLYYVTAALRTYIHHDPVVLLKTLDMFRQLLQMDRKLEKYRNLLVEEVNILLRTAEEHLTNQADLHRINEMAGRLRRESTADKRVVKISEED